LERSGDDEVAIRVGHRRVSALYFALELPCLHASRDAFKRSDLALQENHDVLNVFLSSHSRLEKTATAMCEMPGSDNQLPAIIGQESIIRQSPSFG
jgi:hypothetical protein